jgi:hypothetical protein
VKDLEHGLLGTIQQIEEKLPLLRGNAANGTALRTGAVILFGGTADSDNISHLESWAAFLDDSLECIFNDIRNISHQMLKEFKASAKR